MEALIFAFAVVVIVGIVIKRLNRGYTAKSRIEKEINPILSHEDRTSIALGVAKTALNNIKNGTIGEGVTRYEYVVETLDHISALEKKGD
jgi:hypothetical protein